MKFVVITILIFWLIKVGKDTLFWTYLWQLKEYRLDRMKAHFELESSKRILFNKFYAVRIILALSAGLFFVIEIWQTAFTIITAALYGIFGLRVLQNAYLDKLKLPVFTKKAILICAGVGGLYILISLSSYLYFPKSFFALTLIALDIVLPAIVSGTAGIFRFPSDILKKRIFEKAAAKRSEMKDVLVVGITGSYGKTSMKEFLSHILSQKLRVLKTAGNQNTEISVANIVLNKLNPNYDAFIVEMGAYREGEIKKMCDIVKPQIGIMTGINEQHVSLFGSIKNTLKAKYELIESLPKHGLAVFNGEDEFTNALYEKTRPPKRMYALRSFSVSEKPDITCEKIDFNADGTNFYVKIGDKKELFETPLLGRHNVLNVLGATLVAHELGMSLEEIKEAAKTLSAPPHTLEIKHGINNSIVIDDSYSANPTGVYAALDILSQIRGNRKILILYPLIELGNNASIVHRRIAAGINKACELCILTSPDFAREIQKNATNTDVIIMPDPKRIITKLQKTVKDGDVILIENRVPEEIIKFLTA